MRDITEVNIEEAIKEKLVNYPCTKVRNLANCRIYSDKQKLDGFFEVKAENNLCVGCEIALNRADYERYVKKDT